MIDFSFLLLGLGALLFGPALAIWALVRSYRLGDEVTGLRRDVATLRLAGGPPPGAARDRPAPAPAPEPVPEPEPAPESEAESIVPPPEMDRPPAEDAGFTGDEGPAATPPSTPPFTPATPPGGRVSIEDRLASQWLVWIGAAAMLLGVVFLVKYTSDQGWFGPATWVSLCGLFGLGLMAAGEWLRRGPKQRAAAALRTDYVPPALTSTGLFAAFASVYTAYALYDFLPPGIALILLALVAFAGMALSMIQGPFVALVGVAAGFVTPMLVQTNSPSAWKLFPYLLAIAAAAQFITRYRAWPWLGWTTLGAAALWPLLWFGARWHAGDATPSGIYLVALAALFIFARPDVAQTSGAAEASGGAQTSGPARAPGSARARAPDSARERAWDLHVAVATTVIAAVIFALLRMDLYGAMSIATLAAFSGLTLYAGRRDPRADILPFAASVLSVAAIAAWHLPAILDPDAARSLGSEVHGIWDSRVVLAPDFWTFTVSAAVLAALFGGGGFALLWGAARPARWALLAGATPVALLAAVYWRLTDFQVDIAWGLVAALLAALYVAGAARIAAHRETGGLDEALGLFAAAAIAALGLAATMILRDGWLTVALAVELPALAWIEHRLGVKKLRRVAFAIAAIVLARLVINWNVLDYPMGATPLLNWMLYGYGLPAAAFYAAARMFRRAGDDVLVAVLDAGAIVFSVLLVSLEIRTLSTGSIGGDGYTLFEQSLHSASWLAIGWFLAWRNRGARRPVATWASRALAGAAALQVGLGALLLSNPLWSYEWVGAWPILNVLLLAYAVPAGFAVLFALEFRAEAGEPGAEGLLPWAAASGIAALVLGFVWVSLQVTQLFHGTHLTVGPVTDAEQYAYSAVWLVYAGCLLALGMRFALPVLRYASLVLILLTVGKVFLFDMSALAGLWRVASFFGLGLVLVGIGFVYQRWVFPPGGRGAPPTANAA